MLVMARDVPANIGALAVPLAIHDRGHLGPQIVGWVVHARERRTGSEPEPGITSDCGAINKQLY